VTARLKCVKPLATEHDKPMQREKRCRNSADTVIKEFKQQY